MTDHRTQREAQEDESTRAIYEKFDALTRIIEDHNSRHESDMEEVREQLKKLEPIAQAYLGAQTLGTLFRWVGAIALTIFALIAAVKGIK